MTNVIATMSVMMMLTAALAGFVPVEALSRMTSGGTLLAFAIVCCGVLVLRVREPDWPRAFRVPGGPVVPVLGVGVCLLMMVSLPETTWLRLAAWFVLGLFAYSAYSHRRAAAFRALESERSALLPKVVLRQSAWFGVFCARTLS